MTEPTSDSDRRSFLAGSLAGVGVGLLGSARPAVECWSIRQQTTLEASVEMCRFPRAFLSAVALAISGCTRDSTTPKSEANAPAVSKTPAASSSPAVPPPKDHANVPAVSQTPSAPSSPTVPPPKADAAAPAVSKLLAKVAAITPDNVAAYDKYLAEPSGVHFLLYVAAFPITRDDVKEAVNQRLEKPAVSALIKVIQEKKSSTAKTDRLVGSQAMIALSYFGPSASEALPLLGELQNHEDKAVGSTAKLALAEIGKAK